MLAARSESSGPATVAVTTAFQGGGGFGKNQDLRRKCKGGLYWATMVASKHVHFVLAAS